MDFLEAIDKRHTVRNYLDKDIEEDKLKLLQEYIDAQNYESGLKFQLISNDREVFCGLEVHYGTFEGVHSYIALIGKTSNPKLEELTGYYGQKCLLKAQTLGLNSCWIALTFNKRSVLDRCKILKGEKLVAIISIGYGKTQGFAHNSKSLIELSSITADSPEWFKKGVEIASKAPTARNQQQFYIERVGERGVRIKNLGGEYSKIDYGIVKLHFELGAGADNFHYVD